ncbi:MAG: hypothetical protein ABW221_15565 [Vicinamibacteria bacterium]
MNVRTTNTAALLLSAALLVPGPAPADEWDSAAAGDVGVGTRNTLAHGAEQVHDLQTLGTTLDEDWYRVTVRPMSSYEMVIDGQTGDVGLQSADFQRVSQSGTVLQSASEHDLGFALRLRWSQDAAADTQLVRVRGAACGTACTSTDRYRIRFRETTYTVPRFNNTSTQSTVVFVQNLTARACNYTYYLLTDTGVITAGSGLSPFLVHRFDTSLVAPNRSGSIRIAQDCGYGAFAGKAVAVEPATGFTFDTPLRHRAN